VAIAVGSDEEWHQLCELMGQPELATDARFATHEARAQRPQELRAAIEPWTSARDGHETADALAALGIAGGAFSDPWTMVDDPQIRARGLMERVERAHVGEQAYPGAFLRISGHPFGAQRPAPTLGEHNRLVFGDWLGVSEDRLSELAASGVIGDTPLGQ
jgi:formyl-CoA transferase